jgi:hypothetical protein
MFSLYQDHFEWCAKALMAGRYDELCQRYAFPLPVDLAGLRFVVEDRAGLTVHLHRHRIALYGRDVLGLVPRVVALDLPGRGDRVWVRWRQNLGGRMGLDWSDAIYHMRLEQGIPQVTQMAFTRLMLPEFGRAATHRRLVRGQDGG